MSWEEICGGVGTLEGSAVESKNMGISVARLTVGEGWQKQFSSQSSLQVHLESALDSDSADLIVLRTPSTLIPAINKLNFANKRLLFAGVLVYWEKLIDGISVTSATDTGQIVSADNFPSVRHAEIIQALDSSFENYQNHYTANPALNMDAAVEPYRDWAKSVLRSSPENVVLILIDNEVAGVALIAESTLDAVEVLLAGISKRFQGKGAYSSLLSGILEDARGRGKSRLVISTQVQNIAAQRAWAKAGFSPRIAIDTFHIMRNVRT